MGTEKLSEFIHGLVVSLHAKNSLEIGCSVGNNLVSFPDGFNVIGIDMDGDSLEKAKQKFPSFKFLKGSIFEIPLEDSAVDFVFTKSVLNHIPTEKMQNAMDEMFRVSGKYILNLESYGQDGTMIPSKPESWYRNMESWWSKFSVKIISHVDMHEDIDPSKPRFTLVKKLVN